MFCTKCGRQIPDRSAFCTFCGAPQPQTSEESAQAFDATTPLQAYGERATWQPPPRQVRRGLPACVWVLIGCGALIVLSFGALIAGGVFLSGRLTKELGSLENMQVATEITVIQEAMTAYFETNRKYGNFNELHSAELLAGIVAKTLEDFKIETEMGTYELLLAPDRLHFEIVGTSKKDGHTFKVDEKSGSLFDDMLGIDTSSAAAPGGK